MALCGKLYPSTHLPGVDCMGLSTDLASLEVMTGAGTTVIICQYANGGFVVFRVPTNSVAFLKAADGKPPKTTKPKKPKKEK